MEWREGTRGSSEGKSSLGRVEHKYTEGWVFPHRTQTTVHHNLLQVVPVPYQKSECHMKPVVLQIPTVFIYLKSLK